VFTAVDEILDALEAAALLVEHLRFDRARLAEAASDPALRATDEAERRVLGGEPFRKAHEAVGKAVRDGRVEAPWSVERSLSRRNVPGGPNPRRVAVRSRSALGQAAALAKWAKEHPPPLPL
jgi:argininosuccinate lyase